MGETEIENNLLNALDHHGLVGKIQCEPFASRSSDTHACQHNAHTTLSPPNRKLNLHGAQKCSYEQLMGKPVKPEEVLALRASLASHVWPQTPTPYPWKSSARHVARTQGVCQA